MTAGQKRCLVINMSCNRDSIQIAKMIERYDDWAGDGWPESLDNFDSLRDSKTNWPKKKSKSQLVFGLHFESHFQIKLFHSV